MWKKYMRGLPESLWSTRCGSFSDPEYPLRINSVGYVVESMHGRGRRRPKEQPQRLVDFEEKKDLAKEISGIP